MENLVSRRTQPVTAAPCLRAGQTNLFCHLRQVSVLDEDPRRGLFAGRRVVGKTDIGCEMVHQHGMEEVTSSLTEYDLFHTSMRSILKYLGLATTYLWPPRPSEIRQ